MTNQGQEDIKLLMSSSFYWKFIYVSLNSRDVFFFLFFFPEGHRRRSVSGPLVCKAPGSRPQPQINHTSPILNNRSKGLSGRATKAHGHKFKSPDCCVCRSHWDNCRLSGCIHSGRTTSPMDSGWAQMLHGSILIFKNDLLCPMLVERPFTAILDRDLMD